MKKNKNYKTYILTITLVMFAGIFICNLLAIFVLHKMTEEHHAVIASLLGSVKERYPEVSEEEWIALLNHQEEYEAGEQILEKYGIFQDSAGSIKQQKLSRGLLLVLNVFWVLLCGGMIISAFFFSKKRQKEVELLAAYVRKVERGEYALELPDNTEDELSILKNELYKVTVLLKESAELAKSQKRALSDSVSDISHQLKTPLTSVTVLLDNLLESNSMDETTRKKFLCEISRQVGNMNWLIAALLKLSRLDAGVVEFVKAPIDLDKLLEEVTDKLEIMAEWKQIAIKREGETGIRLTGDLYWMGEAVMNIVKNAIEHSPEESEILILTEENAVYTLITVKDYGPGLTGEEQKHIFERFYRSHNAKEDSVGIGLSLAKEIVEQQNGYLTVSSVQGEGTKFMIKFLKC